MNGANNYPQYDVIKKYEEKIKNIMIALCDVSQENNQNLNGSKKKIENEITELEKIINEECMNRTMITNKLNNALIARLRESEYDFNQDKSQHCYENIIKNTINSMNNYNSN